MVETMASQSPEEYINECKPATRSRHVDTGCTVDSELLTYGYQDRNRRTSSQVWIERSLIFT